MLLLKNVYFEGKTQDILIENNVFQKIAPSIHETHADIFDCTDKAILPSFCNAHTHACMMFLRGVGEDLELFHWLQNKIWPLEDRLTDETIYHISKFAVLEMIKTGTTAFLDMYFHTEETVKAVNEMGLRACLTFTGMDMFDPAETERRIKNAEKFLNTPCPTDRIFKTLSPHAIYTASKDLIMAFRKMVNDRGLFLNMHVSETKYEVDECVKKYGQTPLAILNDWGALDGKTVIAHAVHLTEDEIKIAKEKNIYIAHNPTSNLKLNSGQMPLQHYLDEGLHISLGTDGVSSNNSLSMISETKIAALSGKNQANSTKAAQVNDIFNLATANGFEALGLKAGKIKEGYLADFMLIDLNHHAVLPNINLISNMIYSADSSCITDVFCNGVPLMQNRCVKDEEQITHYFKEACKELLYDQF